MDNNIDELVGILEDLISLDGDMLSDMQVHRLIDRAKDVMRRYTQSNTIRPEVESQLTKKTYNSVESYLKDQTVKLLKRNTSVELL